MFDPKGHNHTHCIEDAIGRALSVCAVRGARLTDLRRQVLGLIWERHEPIGAYDLLAALRTTHRRAAPPTVYRALDFLMEHGLVHRIESLNAYVGCTHPEQAHSGQFLICRACGSIGELDDPAIADSVRARAALQGFRAEHQTIEVRGLCADCGIEAEAPARIVQ